MKKKEDSYGRKKLALNWGVPIPSYPNTGNIEKNGDLKRKKEPLYNGEASIKNWVKSFCISIFEEAENRSFERIDKRRKAEENFPESWTSKRGKPRTSKSYGVS